MTMFPQPEADQLRSIVHGRVLLPGDPDFDERCRPWNLAIEQFPRAVVEAADAGDIARLLQFAHAHGIPVATQPSGHGATGRSTDAILLRTTHLDAVDIDPVARTARIGAGALSGDLQRAAAVHGLTALPGSSPVVSVTGAALGGGLSWFSRSFGWIADGILAAEVVMADGTARRVTSDDDPELLWALRGGGGEIAVVTALELRLHSVPSVFGGRQLWAASDRHDVAEVYLRMTEDAPDALTLWLELLHFPGGEPMIAIDSVFLGDEESARELMRETEDLPRALSDTRAIMSVADLGDITAEPTTPAPGRSRCELLTRVDGPALSALLDEPIAPLVTVQVRHLGGALRERSDSPHGSLAEPYAVYMFGVPVTSELAAAIDRRQKGLAEALPTSGRKPITFLAPGEELSAALPPASLRRLRLLKEKHDPQRIVRGNVALSD